MSEPEPARDQLPPPTLVDEGEEILRRASGGRLLLRMLGAVVVLGALAGGGLLARGYLRARAARAVPTVDFPPRVVSIGNDSRGSEEQKGGALEERPAHPVAVAGFRLDVTEVTVAAYRVCFDEGACTPPAPSAGTHCNWGRADRDAHPVNCVTHTQAEGYCRWARKRLPTEVEWEYAAGGGGPKRHFPWGDTFPLAGDANVCGTECTAGARPAADMLSGNICSTLSGCRLPLFDFDDGFPETAPVGSFPGGKTPEGLLDLAGNVWEWTSSLPCDYPAHACADTGERVIRGGGWTHRYLLSPEVTTRSKLAAGTVSDGVGFRCAR
jgi:formylglycine-generating enzyme required for sulfatase activity